MLNADGSQVVDDQGNLHVSSDVTSARANRGAELTL